MSVHSCPIRLPGQTDKFAHNEAMTSQHWTIRLTAILRFIYCKTLPNFQLTRKKHDEFYLILKECICIISWLERKMWAIEILYLTFLSFMEWINTWSAGVSFQCSLVGQRHQKQEKRKKKVNANGPCQLSCKVLKPKHKSTRSLFSYIEKGDSYMRIVLTQVSKSELTLSTDKTKWRK